MVLPAWDRVLPIETSLTNYCHADEVRISDRLHDGLEMHLYLRAPHAMIIPCFGCESYAPAKRVSNIDDEVMGHLNGRPGCVNTISKVCG